MAPLGEGTACPVCGREASAYAAQAHHLPPGTVLAERYLLGGVLGEGGFGITYMGLDTRLDVKVAVKEYYPRDKAARSGSRFPEVVGLTGLPAEVFARGRKRFLEEARVMARLEKQRAIVGVRDFFEANGTAYIVMEYVEGITLTELVARRGGRVTPGELFPLLEPVFKALITLHGAGLIHRDISPDNIMLEDGQARLLDFGCAREAAAGRQTLTISLKYGYAPIEQYRQKGQGPWTDVYALCATVYYCLTGQTPPQPLDRVPEDTLLLPSKLGAELTVRQERALLKGLRVQPRRRFRSMEQLYEVLYGDMPMPEEERRPGGDHPRAGGPEPRSRRTGRLAACAAALVLVLAAAVCAALGLFRQRADSPVAPGAGKQIDAGVFDGAVELPDGVYGAETFQLLMEDASVSSVVLRSGALLDLNNAEGEPFLLEKPLWTESGSTLCANWLTIPESVALRVDGKLDCRGLISLEGTGTRLQLTGELSPDCADLAVILMERGDNLALGGTLAEALEGRLILQPQTGPVHPVTDLWELSEGLRLYDTLSIEEDLVLDQRYDLTGKTVFVADGVTVSMADSMGELVLDNSVLVNRGEILCIVTATDTVIQNFGTVTYEDPDARLELRDGCTVLNWGKLAPGDISSMEPGSRVTNLGRLDIHTLRDTGGCLANLGAMELLAVGKPVGGGLMIQNNSVFYNGGTLTVGTGAAYESDCWLVNDGLLQVEDCRTFAPMAMNNRHGAVTISKGPGEASGFMLGAGTVPDMTEGPYGWLGVAQTLSPERLPEEYVTVSDEAALRAAMEGDSPVYVSGGIELTGPLEVTTPLYIGGSLTAGPEAAVSVRDTELVLWGEGSLQANVLRVYFGSEVVLTEDSSLTVEAGGELSMEQSILYGSGKSLALDGARLRLKASDFVPERLESFTADGASISLQGGGRLIAPYRRPFAAEDAEIEVNNGQIYFPSDIRLVRASLSSGPDGASIRLTGENVLLEDCAITVTKTGEFVSDAASLTLSGGTRLENDGYVWFSGWDALFTAAGPLVNRGEMYLNAEKRISVPIQNSGTLRLVRSNVWDDQVEVEGDPPIWE